MLALITLVPLVWLLGATMTAGTQKIFIRSRPSVSWRRRGCWTRRFPPRANARFGPLGGDGLAVEKAAKAVRQNRGERFNQVWTRLWRACSLCWS